MKPRSIHRKILLLGLFAGFGCQPPISAGCRKTDVPVKISPDIKVISLKNLSFSSSGSLQAQFLLVNESHQEIIRLTMVLEYRTPHADSLSVVYEAAPETEQPSDRLIPTERVYPLPRPLSPRHKIWISGASPYTLLECPSSARLTMLDIQFEDQSDFRWQSTGWSTMPLLSDYPDTLSIPDSDVWTMREYFFLTKINPDGQVEEIHAIPPTSKVPSSSVAESLKRLTFFPGLTEGKPDSALLIFRVKFNRSERSGLGTNTLSSATEKPTVMKPMALIELAQPQEDPQHDWHFDFGGGFGYRTTRIRHDH